MFNILKLKMMACGSYKLSKLVLAFAGNKIKTQRREMSCLKPSQLDGRRSGRRSQISSAWLWVITCSLKRQASPFSCVYLADIKIKYASSKADRYR